MTQAEIGAELVTFFSGLMDIVNMRAYQRNPSTYIAQKVTAGTLHQESANLLTGGNLPAVEAAVVAASPGYQVGTIVMPPQ